MRKPSTIALLGITGIAIFWLGQLTSTKPAPKADAKVAHYRPARPLAGIDSRKAKPPAHPNVEPRNKVATDRAAADKARLMTPEERVALVKQAMMLTDVGQQADLLCGLISVLPKEEMADVSTVLFQSMNSGNPWSQDTWDSLWVRWGQVDPQGCLANLETMIGYRIPSDAKNFMKGWMESDSQAALAWAKQPTTSVKEAMAAACAISQNCKGDLHQLAADISSLPADSATVRECLLNYYDLALVAGNGSSPAVVYDELPKSLQQAAWPVTMDRLSHIDAQQAADWLNEHLHDPGLDYRATADLVRYMAQDDPEGVAKWTAQFPVSASDTADGSPEHPAMIAVSQWLASDPAAAKAWLLQQPSSAPWVARFLSRSGEYENRH